MTTDSGENREKDHMVIIALGIWVRLRTGMWITTRDQRGWHLETKTKASLSKKLDKHMILWLVCESAIKGGGAGEDNVEVGVTVEQVYTVYANGLQVGI
jgi:hypothetical protein